MSENLELMGNIARAIVNSSKMQDVAWVEITVVVTVDESGVASEIFGYAYDENGATPPLPRSCVRSSSLCRHTGSGFVRTETKDSERFYFSSIE